MADVKVTISGDASGAVRAAKDAESSMSGLQKTASSAGKAIEEKLGGTKIGSALDKVGLSAGKLGGALSASIPGAAAAAAGAITAFAVSSIGKFQETALAAGKFADASGLSVESASRYIAVADDIGVGADTIQNAFLKMEKAIGSNRAAFGDLVATTKDGGTDLDKTFLNAIKHLQGIKDPIERATESSKLFGKGYADVAQIIGTNADSLKQKLADVSKAQVIDAKELQSARDYQAAMDNLGDSVGDVQRQVGGELVPALADAANGFALGIEKASEFGIKLSPLVSNAEAFTAALGPFAVLGALMDNSVTGIGKVKGALDGIDLSNLDAGIVSAGGFGSALDTAAASAKDLKDKWDLLNGSLSVKDAQLSLEDGFAGVKKAAEEAWTATANGSEDAAAKVNDHKQDVVNLEQKVAEYGKTVLGLPPEQVSDIIALIDAGKLDEAQAALDKAAEARTAAFKAKEDTGATSAVERAFEQAARQRSASMKAQADNLPAANVALDGVAHSRAASIAANANTGSAESQLNNVARPRTAVITAAFAGVSAHGAVTLHFAHGGEVPGPIGSAQAAIVHGGEYVLSTDVVDRIKQGRRSQGATAASLVPIGGGSTGAPSTYITINTGVGDPIAIGRELQRVLGVSRSAGLN